MVAGVVLVPGEAREGRSDLPGRTEHARHLADAEGDAARNRPGIPARGRLGLLHGLGGQQGGDELGAGDAVHHAVVDLRDDGEAVALEALDDPELPQRLLAVEALGEDAPDHALELTLGSRSGQPRVAHVVADVEGGVVHPDGVLLERRVGQALAVARDAIESRGDVLLDAADVEGAVGGPQGRGLVDLGGGDVGGAVGLGVLVDEERVVHLGEPVVVGVGHGLASQSLRRTSNSRSMASTKSCTSGIASQSALKPQ